MRVLLLMVLLAAPAFADDSGVLDDGGFPSLPDGSVNTGTPDPTQEGEDGKVVTFCRQSSDCLQGFTCIDAKCKYTGPRLAECGCSATSAPLLGLGVLALLAWRRRVERQTTR